MQMQMQPSRRTKEAAPEYCERLIVAQNACVYIVKCSDSSYYVGKYQGEYVERRIAEHNHANYENAYTASRRPVELVWCEWFDRFSDAVAFERQIKGWSRRKKEALIAGEFEKLPALSQCGFKPKKD